MTSAAAATICGVFRLCKDATPRPTPSGDLCANLLLAYHYGKPGEHGKKQTQYIDAGLWGKRADSLCNRLRADTLLFVVVEDPHVETYTRQDGTTATKLVGRCGRLEIIATHDKEQGHVAADPGIHP